MQQQPFDSQELDNWLEGEGCHIGMMDTSHVSTDQECRTGESFSDNDVNDNDNDIDDDNDNDAGMVIELDSQVMVVDEDSRYGYGEVQYLNTQQNTQNVLIHHTQQNTQNWLMRINQDSQLFRDIMFSAPNAYLAPSQAPAPAAPAVDAVSTYRAVPPSELLFYILAMLDIYTVHRGGAAGEIDCENGVFEPVQAHYPPKYINMAKDLRTIAPAPVSNSRRAEGTNLNAHPTVPPK